MSVRVAVVQATPVVLDAEASVAKACDLIGVISGVSVSMWRSMAQDVQNATGGSQGGSVSRANFIATLVATEHNKQAPVGAELTTPLSAVSTPKAA